MSDANVPPRSPAPVSLVPELPPVLFTWARRAESDGSIRLVLGGELDLAARPHFQFALDAAQDDSDRILLDLPALTLIDCAALAVIFGAAERSRREATSLALLCPRGQVRRVLELVGAPAGVAVLDRGLAGRGAPMVA